MVTSCRQLSPSSGREHKDLYVFSRVAMAIIMIMMGRRKIKTENRNRDKIAFSHLDTTRLRHIRKERR